MHIGLGAYWVTEHQRLETSRVTTQNSAAKLRWRESCTLSSDVIEILFLCNFFLLLHLLMKTLPQVLEQVAFEQDKESDRLAILAAMQHHRKELQRY